MHARAQILEIPVSAISMQDALEMIDRWIAEGAPKYICTLDVHALMAGRSDLGVRRVYAAADMVTPDGMPLVWLLHRRGYPRAERICGPDLMPALFRHSEARGYRHFLYGASPATLAMLRQTLERRYPGAPIVGMHSPPYRELTRAEDAEIDRLLNAAAPDIVWVGLGAPKQDRWMAAHRDKLTAPILIGVGAAFDFVAGRIPRAPALLQRTGCEWLFRIAQEPGRLWKRYLVSNSQFALALIGERMHPARAEHRT